MISYFPDIYPDELVYSVLSRCYEGSGFMSYTYAAQEFFTNYPERPRPEFTNAYTGQIRIMLTANTSMKTLVLDHTMLPYYARFLPLERRKEALREAKKGSSELNNKVGYGNKKTPGKKKLRYCPLCVEQDRSKYGEAYWHRDHQMMGIGICPEHQCYLIESGVEISSKASPGLFSLEECISDMTVSRCNNDMEIRLAEYVAAVFHSPVDMTGAVGVGEFLNNKLAGTPYQSARGEQRNISLLAENFRAYYRDLPGNWFTELSQIQQVFKGKRTNTVEICMLAMFLGIGADELVRLKPDSTVKERIAGYDRQIMTLREQGLNYRQISEIVGGSYHYVKAIGERLGRKMRRD